MKRIATMFLAGCLAIGLVNGITLAEHEKGSAKSSLCHANEALNTIIRDKDGKQIGRVKDMIIDSNGRVALFIVQFDSGFVEGDRLYAVPPRAFKPNMKDAKSKEVVLEAGKERFPASAGFTRDKMPDFNNEAWMRETHRNLGQDPYWEVKFEPADRDRPVEQKDPGKAPAREPANDSSRQPSKDPNLTPSVTKTDADRQRELSQAPQFNREHTWMNRLSEILGKPVVDKTGENLGKVTDLIIDTRNARVLYVVLSDGGTLGLGEQLTPIPYSALNAEAEKKQYVVDATKESLKKISFKEDAWPRLTDRNWANSIHAQFNQDPYWAVYGFADTAEIDANWRRDSAYNKSFDKARMASVVGKVTAISEFSPIKDGARGRQITLLTEDNKTYTIHLGPSSYMGEQDAKFMIKEGDTLSVLGSLVTFESKDVMIATKVTDRDGKTLELRDVSGQPKWDAQDQPKNDSGTGRSTNPDREQPKPNSK